MPRKQQGWITFQSSETERQILDQYCQQSQRTKTEILRELVRSLDGQSAPSPSPSAALETAEPDLEIPDLEIPNPETPDLETPDLETPDLPDLEEAIDLPIDLPAVKISARNLLRATVKRMVIGTVSVEVTLEIAPSVLLVSVITRASAENLGLAAGKAVYAVIKSSNVMIAEG